MADTPIVKSTAEDIINTIRDNMKEEYAKRIPEATRDNIALVGKAITTDEIVMNEFLDALINKVVFTKICNKAKFENPFSPVKEADVPLGANIEEIYINPAADTGYQQDPMLLFKTTKPDGKACYYGMNRKGRYPVTIMEEDLARAFTSGDKFMETLNTIIATLYSGDSIDEFDLCKNTLGAAINNDAIVVTEARIATPKEIAKSMSKISFDMSFPRTQYCGYNRVNNLLAGTSEEKPCITWTPQKDQYMVLTYDAKVEIDFEYLASLYNMSLAELNMRKIIVDDIPCDNYKIHAIIMDKAALQFRDAVNKMKKFENGSNLETNYFYHHRQFFYVSMFANCVAFGEPI